MVLMHSSESRIVDADCVVSLIVGATAGWQAFPKIFLVFRVTVE
jgi:hypothetical protein